MFKLDLEKAEESEIELPTSLQFSSVQLLSRVRLFATPWIAARQASLSITNSQSLPKLTFIEVAMPSSHLILCRPLLLLPPIPPSIRVFSTESILRIMWQKYWNFSFSISPPNEHSRLIIKKARECQKNIYFCFIDYAFDCVDHNQLWKILKEMRIPDHLTYLLRNLYAGQEAKVRTGHGTMDWFQIKKGVCQGCIWSPCLFNLYAKYTMWNAKLESRLQREISINTDTQLTLSLWQKKN